MKTASIQENERFGVELDAMRCNRAGEECEIRVCDRFHRKKECGEREAMNQIK